MLSHLPTKTGLALVIVSHLDPDRPSLLARLLSGAATMTVAEITDGVELHADHVYVLPAGSDVTLAAGRLRLAPRRAADRVHLPIDGFFKSLAAEQGARSIGIVLTGAASDGTVGLGAIKEAGGVTFAQDPSEAEHASMPASAIAAGVVDFVLPVRAIAEELVELIPRSAAGDAVGTSWEPAGEQEPDRFEEVLALLRSSRGVDFSGYKPSTLRRRLARRMLVSRSHSLEQYVDHLHGHSEELDALYDDLLITVTEFFRDPTTFDVLRTEVLPALIRDKPAGETVRLWVPGCASGEEAYSFAIAVFEAMAHLGVRRPLKVFATDISERALTTARRGVYPATLVSGIDRDLLQRYFVPGSGDYQVIKSVRECCVFARHDLTRDPPFSRLDLVSCRNVLIYMSAELQRRILPLLQYALAPGGCLVLGKS